MVSDVPVLTDEQLDNLRQLLERDRAQLVLHLEGLSQDSGPVVLDQQLQGRLSRMDALQQQAMTQAGERQVREQLRDIHQAQQAMDQDEYGYCTHCGLAIGYGRLAARPASSLCVQCAGSLEQK